MLTITNSKNSPSCSLTIGVFVTASHVDTAYHSHDRIKSNYGMFAVGFDGGGNIQREGPAREPKPHPSIPQIPFELYRQIVEIIENRSTLVSLCLTSRSFKLEAERILYHSMTVPQTTTSSHLQFLQTVTNVERLALLVHIYQFPCLDRDPHSPFEQLVISGLQAMVNLRHLRLRGLPCYMQQYSSRPNAFEGCTFRLQTLHIHHLIDMRVFFSLVATQSQLRKLTVYLRNGGQVLLESACQKLDVLQGNRAAIEAILPFRKISTLIWDPDSYDMNRPMSHLAEPLSRVRVFSFQGCYMRPSLWTVIDYLKSLEYLELVTLRVGELEVVRQLQSLKGLVLTDAFSFGIWRQRLITAITPIFLSCSNLEFIDIQQANYAGSLRMYERWELIKTSSTPIMHGLLQKQVVCRRFAGV